MRISSARSASNCRRPIHRRSRFDKRISALHHARNAGQKKVETAFFLHELLSSCRGNAVIPGAPVVFGHRPLSGYELVEQQTLEGRIKGSLSDLESVVGHLLDVLRDSPPVVWPAAERF